MIASNSLFSLLLLLLNLLFYFTLNTALNVSNRWLLGVRGISFPITLTMIHMLFTSLFFGPFIIPKLLHNHEKKLQWGLIAAVACMQAANIALNNASLVFLPLTTAQMIRSSSPLVTALINSYLNKKMPTVQELLSLGSVFIGVTLCLTTNAAFSESGASTKGVAVAFAGVVCASAMLSSSSKLMKTIPDPLEFSVSMSPFATLALALVALIIEGSRLQSFQSLFDRPLLAVVLASCVAAAVYNVCAALLLRQTSPVWMNLFGQLRVVVLLVVSSRTLPGDSLSLNAAIGATFVVAGVAMYSWSSFYAKHLEETPSKKPLVLCQNKTSKNQKMLPL